jgi:hypothetical protein
VYLFAATGGSSIDVGASMRPGTFREGLPMMNKTFEIDGIAYRVAYEDHFFHFTIAPPRSITCRAEKDPVGAFHDAVAERTSRRSPRTALRAILEVKREVMNFIDQALCEYRPYFFTFSANEHVSISLYRRIAARIARTHGFTLYVAPAHSDRGWERFFFYCQVGGCGATS